MSRRILHATVNGTPVAGFAACALPPAPQAAGDARRFTRATLDGWGMRLLVDSVAVVVSELLSNALRYGLTPPVGHGPTVQDHAGDRSGGGRPVCLGLLRRRATVLCTVCDHSRDVPVMRAPGDLAQSGRGLHIVDSLSRCWGWTTPSPAGKAVWAVVSGPG